MLTLKNLPPWEHCPLLWQRGPETPLGAFVSCLLLGCKQTSSLCLHEHIYGCTSPSKELSQPFVTPQTPKFVLTMVYHSGLGTCSRKMSGCKQHKTVRPLGACTLQPPQAGPPRASRARSCRGFPGAVSASGAYSSCPQCCCSSDFYSSACL